MAAPAFVKWVWEQAKPLGFSHYEHAGGGHVKLHHQGGGFVVAPSTPTNEWRERKNVLAELEKLSGQKADRPNAAKFRHQRKRTSFRDSRPSRMSPRARRLADLGAKLEGLDAEIRETISQGAGEQEWRKAKSLMRVREKVVQSIEDLGGDVKEFML